MSPNSSTNSHRAPFSKGSSRYVFTVLPTHRKITMVRRGGSKIARPRNTARRNGSSGRRRLGVLGAVESKGFMGFSLLPQIVAEPGRRARACPLADRPSGRRCRPRDDDHGHACGARLAQYTGRLVGRGAARHNIIDQKQMGLFYRIARPGGKGARTLALRWAGDKLNWGRVLRSRRSSRGDRGTLNCRASTSATRAAEFVPWAIRRRQFSGTGTII